MSTAPAVISSFDILEWNATIYEALSNASRLAITIRDKANVLRIAYSLHGVNRTLEDFFRKVDDAANGRLPKNPDTELGTPERIQEVAYALSELHEKIAYIQKA